MMLKLNTRVVVTVISCAIAACVWAPIASAGVSNELRGIYVTTVFNSEWPSRQSMTEAEAQDEINVIVDNAVNLECNAIFLQVRGLGDRLYESTMTTIDVPPWSQSLVPKAVAPPENTPGYNPLALWAQSCHDAGLELYAWVNLYRMDFPIPDVPPNGPPNPPTPYPNLPFYGADDHFLYLYPNSEDVQRHLIRVFDDLLNNYDLFGHNEKGEERPWGGNGGLDGVIVDHYFPPPPSNAQGHGAHKGHDGKDPKQSDDAEGKAHLLTTFSTRRQWLLDNRNNGIKPGPSDPVLTQDLLKLIAAHVHARKGHFAVSPDHDQLTMVQDWLDGGVEFDFIAPQIYEKKTDFTTQLGDWAAVATHGKNPPILPVLSTMYIHRPKPGDTVWTAGDIMDDIAAADQFQAQRGVKGHIHYGCNVLRPLHGAPAYGKVAKERKLADLLHPADETGRYSNAAAALMPRGIHLPTADKPDPPQESKKELKFSIKRFTVRRWFYQLHDKTTNTYTAWRSPVHKGNGQDLGHSADSIPMPDKSVYDRIKLTAVDANNISCSDAEFPL